MFTSVRTIYLQQTDSTGVLYFTQLLQVGQEAFEEYWKSKGYTVKQMIDSGDFLLPIVHTEGEYMAPIMVGDEVKITLSLKKLGTSSFTIEAEVSRGLDGKVVGISRITHVCVDRNSGSPKPIEGSLLRDLRELGELSFH